MKRTFLIAVGMIVAAACIGSAQAGEGGGGGGGGGGSETYGAPNPHAFFAGRAPGRIPGRALIAPPEPSGSTVLPGGTFVRLDGWKANREVLVVSPDHGRFRGKHIRTTYNPATGITSVWIRNANGSRTGIHTDRAGNQMVSEHRF